MRHTRMVLAGLACASMVASATPASAQSELERRSVLINGMEMYLEIVGQGPPLLLLHRFGGCGRLFDPFIPRLAAKYRLIIPDLRGHGRSTNPSGVFTHRQAAQDVLALLDTLGLERVRAIGFSSGGMTLLHVATTDRDRIESMALVGATSHFGREARAIFRASDADRMSPAEYADWDKCSSRGEAQTREIIRQFHGFLESYDDMNFTAPFLSSIRARTLVVHGDRDAIFPVEIAVGMYRAIPESELWIIPDGSHLPVYGRRAEAFVDTVLGFLGGMWVTDGP